MSSSSFDAGSSTPLLPVSYLCRLAPTVFADIFDLPENKIQLRHTLLRSSLIPRSLIPTNHDVVNDVSSAVDDAVDDICGVKCPENHSDDLSLTPL